MTIEIVDLPIKNGGSFSVHLSPKIISTLDQLGLDQKTLWTPMRINKLKIT